MKRSESSPQNLNLAPILNLVVILIPMLLLAIVFLSAGVINVQTPHLSPTSSSQPATTTPPVVAISTDRFIVQSADGEPIEIRSKNPTVARESAHRITAAHERGDSAKINRAIADWVSAYDYDGLHDALVELPGDGSVIHLSADANVPYAVIVRTMDAVRHRVERRPTESIWTGRKVGALFSDPTLAIAK